MARSMDDAILDVIFNPVLQQNPAALLYTPLDELLGNKADEREKTPEEKAAAQEEIKAVGLANAKKYDEALVVLNGIVEKLPSYASAYNNRAQVLRLLNRDDDALVDLTKAIELTDGKSKVAENAYMQRAALYRVRHMDDQARADFQKAAALGNVMAKSELVALNPYAAMCNQMLAEVMEKAKQGGTNVMKPDAQQCSGDSQGEKGQGQAER